MTIILAHIHLLTVYILRIIQIIGFKEELSKKTPFSWWTNKISKVLKVSLKFWKHYFRHSISSDYIGANGGVGENWPENRKPALNVFSDTSKLVPQLKRLISFLEENKNQLSNL